MRLLLRGAALVLLAAGCVAEESESQDPVPPTFAPGVPADACASGFEPEEGGCRVVLPAEACAPGWMTLPGETSCREVVPCGAPPYGDIPVDGTTEFVDAAYAGTDSDGTLAKPWRTIQEAVDAAVNGAIVAVVAGSYVENVVISGKPVRLWGRCPSLSEIRGAGDFAVVLVLEGASASEIRGLGIRSDEVEYGIAVSGPDDVLVEGVWVHDTGLPGVQADVSQSPTNLTLRGSLIEAAGGMGVYMHGASVLVESTEVRASREDTLGGLGRGITGVDYPDTLSRANVRVVQSLVRNTREAAILTSGSDLAIEATAILDTAPAATALYGVGVIAQMSLDTGDRSTLSIASSVIERSYNTGILLLGSDADIDTTVVRDVLPTPSSFGGRGINVQFEVETMAPSNATIRASLVERTYEVGIAIIESTAIIEATWVRDTVARPSDGLHGDGVLVSTVFTAASAQVTRSRIERSARAGTFNSGAVLSLGESALECNPIQLNGQPSAGYDFTFSDLGGNSCGCAGVPDSCAVRDAGLTPPEPLEH